MLDDLHILIRFKGWKGSLGFKCDITFSIRDFEGNERVSPIGDLYV
jgi:hypothetical protein